MASVQSCIRAKVKLGEFPAPKGAEAFCAYGISSSKRLIPEMENAARQTLNYSMTFEDLGERLRLLDGWALHDLSNFRKRCRDGVIQSLDLFLKVRPPGPSSIWVGCPEVMPRSSYESDEDEEGEDDGEDEDEDEGDGEDEDEEDLVLPRWLSRLLLTNQDNLKLQNFTHALDIHSRIHREYITALRNHRNCYFCLKVHLKNGSTFCTELGNTLAQARDKVT